MKKMKYWHITTRMTLKAKDDIDDIFREPLIFIFKKMAETSKHGTLLV